MANERNNLEDTLNFLCEAKDIVSIALAINDGTKESNREHIRNKISNFKKQYPNLPKPEKDYLNSLERRYFNDFLSKFSEKELEILDTPLKDLDVTVRLYNQLRHFSGGKSGDVLRYGEIVGYQRKDIMKMEAFGKKSIEELKNIVEEKGYKLGQNIEYIPPENR